MLVATRYQRLRKHKYDIDKLYQMYGSFMKKIEFRNFDESINYLLSKYDKMDQFIRLCEDEKINELKEYYWHV